jgi:hypothetical protein
MRDAHRSSRLAKGRSRPVRAAAHIEGELSDAPLQLVPSYSLRSRVSDGWRAYDPSSAAPLVSPTKDWINCARAKAGLGLFPSPVRKAGLGPPIRHATPIAANPVNSIEDPIQSRHL